MSDSLSRIADDEDEYEYLCRKYGEKVSTKFNPYLGGNQTDIYGNHACFLKDFNRGDLGTDFQRAKNKFFGDINKREKKIKDKIAAAKAKLTPEELELLDID